MLKKSIECLVITVSLFFASYPVYAEVGAAQVSIVDFKSTSWDKSLATAVRSGAKKIYFPKGTYGFDKGVVLNSSDLTIFGDGIIYPTKKIARLLTLKGNNNRVSVNIDGKNRLENALRLEGNNVSVIDSHISNLHGFGKNSAIAIYVVSNGKFNVSNNEIENIYAVGDGKSINGVGMTRGISISRKGQGKMEHSIIRGNKISNVYGEEGDSITLISQTGTGKYGVINADVVDNTIHNYSRRAIKTQGSDVRIISNNISNSYDPTKQYNCSSAISVYTATNTLIKGNFTKIEKCRSVGIFMGKDHPNLADASNVEIIDNQLETSSDNDVPLINISVAGGHLDKLKVSGNRATGQSQGFQIGRSEGAEITNNSIRLRVKATDQRFIKAVNRRQQEIIKNNQFELIN